MTVIKGVRVPDAIRTCATCGTQKRTSAAAPVWYCPDHRFCAMPGCENKVYIINSVCRDCHKKSHHSGGYNTSKPVKVKCDFCDTVHVWSEYYVATNQYNLRCTKCKDFITQEMRDIAARRKRMSVRNCAWCGAKLSAYNKGKVCNPCWTSASISERSKRKWSSESKVSL